MKKLLFFSCLCFVSPFAHGDNLDFSKIKMEVISSAIENRDPSYIAEMTKILSKKATQFLNKKGLEASDEVAFKRHLKASVTLYIAWSAVSRTAETRAGIDLSTDEGREFGDLIWKVSIASSWGSAGGTYGTEAVWGPWNDSAMGAAWNVSTDAMRESVREDIESAALHILEAYSSLDISTKARLYYRIPEFIVLKYIYENFETFFDKVYESTLAKVHMNTRFPSKEFLLKIKEAADNKPHPQTSLWLIFHPYLQDAHYQQKKTDSGILNLGNYLIEAVKDGDKETVKILLDKGANTEFRCDAGITPLHWATHKKHKEIVEILLDRGANIEARDCNGWTPLHFAASSGYAEIVEILLDRGANAKAKGEHGRTPSDVARTDEIKNLISAVI